MRDILQNKENNVKRIDKPIAGSYTATVIQLHINP